MDFTILYGTSTRFCNYLLTLNKSGNMYVVTLTDKSVWRTVETYETDTYDDAKAEFDTIAYAYDINLIKETDTSDAYAYIDSQYN